LNNRRGKVVSDRFSALEDPSDWKNTRPWAIDDCQHRGRAREKLWRAVERLCGSGSLGPEQERLKIALDFSQAQAGEDKGGMLHQQYALAFSRSVTPLFSDFPISKEIILSPATIEKLSSEEGRAHWLIADVTNTAIADDGVRA
jgi:hypothetical protein